VKRLFDLVFAGIISIVLFFPMLLVAVMVRVTSEGPVLFWSDRIGQRNVIFRMPKFRTMRLNTPVVGTHLMSDPDKFLSPIGEFLRRTSLDELPQLLSILKGDMSFVGPRPALYNQVDLITLRTEKGVDQLVPGLTGWAQVNGRDELLILEKVMLDIEYLKRRSFWFDLRILWLTCLKVVKSEGILH
jgi:O-antigen biosynthesis protein WbqP